MFPHQGLLQPSAPRGKGRNVVPQCAALEPVYLTANRWLRQWGLNQPCLGNTHVCIHTQHKHTHAFMHACTNQNHTHIHARMHARINTHPKTTKLFTKNEKEGAPWTFILKTQRHVYLYQSDLNVSIVSALYTPHLSSYDFDIYVAFIVC